MYVREVEMIIVLVYLDWNDDNLEWKKELLPYFLGKKHISFCLK